MTDDSTADSITGSTTGSTAGTRPGPGRVTVGIKALNEERHIDAAIASALAAVAKAGGGKVVLADSGSSDATLALAARYDDVEIVQIERIWERGCGAGAQMAFQSATGEYFYLLDGDMVLDAGFLAAGMAFLDANPGHAGVGGVVREADTSSIEFELRARNDREKGSAIAGDVDRLDCGGLYRISAVRQLGYFADRNLHAFEEFDLGARLLAAGWKLARIDVPAVDHYGHAVGGYRLMFRRLLTGYAGGPGEILRAAIGRPHFWQIVRRFGQLRNGVAVWCWWTALVLALVQQAWPVLVGIGLLPLAFLSYRRRSLRLGLYSLAVWNFVATGLISGLFRQRVSPDEPIRTRLIRHGS